MAGSEDALSRAVLQRARKVLACPGTVLVTVGRAVGVVKLCAARPGRRVWLAEWREEPAVTEPLDETAAAAAEV